ncbi:hypothetical protein [Cohnella thailandensis]|uniref:Uncharacterized protein n=1 Tax=Cohnella thailandensis TaxID=557557 RepID=A0A841STS8_9BACL|nr:hypothetical protein [Cohnella thailandensis]MBB6634409.1 hypothetical protein [Cohnella thailandensis]MBP1972091.1 uncharacterized membrane protein YcaP (DUF421 family) [Cohnella thailandensis]
MNNTDPYSFAQLRQEDIQQIRQLEERLAESSGHPITLIAYEEQQQPSKEQ